MTFTEALGDFRTKHPTWTIVIAVILAFLILFIVSFVSIKILDKGNFIPNGRIFGMSLMITLLYCAIDVIIALLVNQDQVGKTTAPAK